MIDEIKAITEGSSAAGNVIAKVFPGIAARSMDNAASASLHAAMSDVEDVLAWADRTGMPDDMRNTMLNFLFEKRGSDQRIRECLEFAAPQIHDDADTDNLDQEWIDYWRMHAEKTRDEDVQAIWGAILAGEVNNAGSVSKRTMSILADMERRDAEAFTTLCSRCMGGEKINGEVDPPTPVLIDSDERFSMNPESISRLRSLGLIDFSLGAGMRMTRSWDCVPGMLFQVNTTTFILQGDGQARFSICEYPFTEHGLEIAKLCTLGNGSGFAQGLVEHWKTLGFKVGIATEYVNRDQVRFSPV